MNVYEELNLPKVINASGKMTALGTSIIDSRVSEYMSEAAMNYVNIRELIDKAGEIISKYTGADDSCVTSCAAAGIAISTAACIAKDDGSAIEALPQSDGMKNGIIIQKGHSVNFGAPVVQMIRIGGGLPVEVGQANKVETFHIENAINEKTAALFYVKSHHAVQKGMVSIEDMVEIAKRHDLPLIIDAAAEEDLKKYISMGADLVIYSGAKAIEGPTSGFITGNKKLIGYCKLQYKGIGRAMKVGKENIMGLLKALELYSQKDKGPLVKRQKEMLDRINIEVNKIKGLSAGIIKDEAGRDIYRSQIKIDLKELGVDASYIIKELEGGSPAIYTRNHYANIGIINVDPRPMKDGDAELFVKKLKNIICNIKSKS